MTPDVLGEGGLYLRGAQLALGLISVVPCFSLRCLARCFLQLQRRFTGLPTIRMGRFM